MCPSPIELSNGLGLHKPMLLASAQRAARVRDLDESERMWTDGPALFARLRAKMLFSPLCLLFNNWSLLHALQDFKIQDLSHFKWTERDRREAEDDAGGCRWRHVRCQRRAISRVGLFIRLRRGLDPIHNIALYLSPGSLPAMPHARSGESFPHLTSDLPT